MKNYKIEDFIKGESVYHKSNTKIKMVVIEILKELDEINCRWTDSKGNIQMQGFLPEELGKYDDLRPRIRVTSF